MNAIAAIILIIGTLLSLVGLLSLLRAVFDHSKIWFIACIVTPPIGWILFCILNPAEAKKPVLLLLTSTLLIGAGYWISPELIDL
jgi:hypothetical protein